MLRIFLAKLFDGEGGKVDGGTNPGTSARGRLPASFSILRRK